MLLIERIATTYHAYDALGSQVIADFAIILQILKYAPTTDINMNIIMFNCITCY